MACREKSRNLANEDALAHWGLSRQKHTRVVILNILRYLFSRYSLLATAKLTQQECLGLQAANTVLANVLEDKSCQVPL